MTTLLRLLCATSLVLTLGCWGGSSHSGDHVATVNWTMTITPGTGALAVGQSLQFVASTPWGNQTQWSVMPASAGTITSSGLFTAGATTGTCILYAVWSQDVRYTASANVTILPAPPAAVTTPNFVQASGTTQVVTGTAIGNSPVVGESIPAVNVTVVGDPTIKVRHGFEPPK